MTIIEARPASADAALDIGPDQPAMPAPALVHADPHELVLDDNVRDETPLDKQFLGSVRDLGVLVPVSAHRGEDGRLRVLLGQQRTRAARQVGLASVPVYVIEAPTQEKAAQIARIVEQLAENDHRTGLPDADRVAAHQQLSLLGLSATAIARRTHTPVKSVKTSLAVAGSEVAAAALRRYDLTLDQAAVLAEFTGDSDADREAVVALTAAAQETPEQFDHVAQRARDVRVAAAARAAAVEALTSAGVPVVDPPEQPWALETSGPMRPLSRLKPAGEPDGTDLTEVAHADCPGHAAFVEERPRWNGPDEHTPVFVCTDWREHGHEDRWSASASSTVRSDGPMSDEQKLDRARVIAGNKAWDSAQTVRRRWLKQFMARKAAPKDAPQWIAVTLAGSTHEIRRAMEGGHQLALELLGLGTETEWTPWSSQPHPLAEAAQTATPARAGVLTLSMLIAGIEKGIDRQAWRQPTRMLRYYLTTLESWGYALSDAERAAAAEPADSGADTQDVEETTEDITVGVEQDVSENGAAGDAAADDATEAEPVSEQANDGAS